VADLTFAQHMTIAARSYMVLKLDECDGNISELARRTGLRRQYIYDLFVQLGLRPDTHRAKELGRETTARVFREWAGSKWGGLCDGAA
jgi:hypothetical protein